MNLGSSIGGIRKVASVFVALVLLFSMFTNAFHAFTPDCCRAGKMCPIHHEHAMPTKAGEKSYMDCEHERKDLQSCSMSCRRSDEPGLQQTTVVFLLPDSGPAGVLIPVEATSFAEPVPHSDLAIRPLTPPPRFSFSL